MTNFKRTQNPHTSYGNGLMNEVLFVGFIIIITFAGLASYAINEVNTRCNAPENILSYAKVVEVQKHRYTEKQLKDAEDTIAQYDLTNCE